MLPLLTEWIPTGALRRLRYRYRLLVVVRCLFAGWEIPD
jgi:hypothetical protein